MLVHIMFAALMLAPPPGQSNVCAPLTDEVAASLRHWVISVATHTDSAALADQANFSIPQASISKIKIMTKESTCSAALAAYNAELGVPVGTARVMAVVQVGQSYVVEDVALVSGMRVGMIFSKQWNLLARYQI